LFTLVRAYAGYRKLVCAKDNQQRTTHQAPWDLVLLGDGPPREDINRELITLNLQNCVLLPGFKQYDELPVYYGLANAFVHASLSEPWGLVVNEAMASGLPVIVSKHCGCARDLVIEGENGFQFDPTHARALSDLMCRIIIMPQTQLTEMGENSRRIVQKFSLESFGRQFQSAGEVAQANNRQQSGVMTKMLLDILIRVSNTEARRLLPSTCFDSVI
jgi:1,2-diacylglycerol 3-alpha-glucosyltransferase